jgi:hypothetical protein
MPENLRLERGFRCNGFETLLALGKLFKTDRVLKS